MPRLYFKDLHKKETIKLIEIKLGLAQNKVQQRGVYIFTCKKTSQKYVGSSNQLALRLRGYLNQTHRKTSLRTKLIPLIKEFGLSNFTLEVLCLPYYSEIKPEIVLEQYYLLDPSFNLNTIKVSNNPSGSTAKPLYLLDCLYNNMQKRYNSTLSNNNKTNNLNPKFITGLVDAEGSFIISVCKRSKLKKYNWKVQASLQIRMNSKDLALLVLVQHFFKYIGSFYHNKKTNTVNYSITKLSDLVNIIVPHFNKYPLHSAKSIDFKLWAQCIEKLKNKQHLTKKGLNEILSLKSVLNWGLSERIKEEFPNIKYIDRPEFDTSNFCLDPYWISGFSEGDSSFYVQIWNEKQIRCVFLIELHEREVFLLYKLQEFFNGIGNVSVYSARSIARYSVTRISDLVDYILPHFSKFELVGSKLPNFLLWSRILKLVHIKAHLTPEGLQKIQELKLHLHKEEVTSEKSRKNTT